MAVGEGGSPGDAVLVGVGVRVAGVGVRVGWVDVAVACVGAIVAVAVGTARAAPPQNPPTRLYEPPLRTPASGCPTVPPRE